MDAAILTIFFLSGAAGLVYEVVWTRQLSLIFGVTTYAVATVLATFMAGLAFGSYVFGRWVDRRRNTLLAYAALEAGVGLYALLVPSLLAALRPAYVLLHRLDVPHAALASGRALLAALVLLVPTTLMGRHLSGPRSLQRAVSRRGGVNSTAPIRRAQSAIRMSLTSELWGPEPGAARNHEVRRRSADRRAIRPNTGSRDSSTASLSSAH